MHISRTSLRPVRHGIIAIPPDVSGKHSQHPIPSLAKPQPSHPMSSHALQKKSLYSMCAVCSPQSPSPNFMTSLFRPSLVGPARHLHGSHQCTVGRLFHKFARPSTIELHRTEREESSFTARHGLLYIRVVMPRQKPRCFALPRCRLWVSHPSFFAVLDGRLFGRLGSLAFEAREKALCLCILVNGCAPDSVMTVAAQYYTRMWCDIHPVCIQVG